MIATIDPRALPAMAENKLYLDYIAGSVAVADFYTHSYGDFAGALEHRRGYDYPRKAVSRQLAEYNARLGAHSCALARIEALGDPGTFCVVAGQQAGFLGGPVYTTYKIVTAIRLARYLEEYLGARCVPVFWLASEDHDFGEINHAYLLKSDGEVGRVRFRWRQEGRPISDLPITDDVKRAYDEYFAAMLGPYAAQVRERFAYRTGEDFCVWQARIWSQLFSTHGLVIVEPRILRAPVPEFFRSALEHADEIQRRLDDVSRRLIAAGYTPALTSDQAGYLYTFDSAGQRVRVQDPQAHLARAAEYPERYSTDAALRPLFADATLPVVASVLGPGETAYQGMLRPLYDLFGVPQPLLFPRKSHTIVAQEEAERLSQYRTSVEAVLTEQLDLDETFRDLVPVSDRQIFGTARQGVKAAFSPLSSYLEGIDPSLTRTWSQTLNNSMRNLDKLEERAFKARMSQWGFSKGDLRSLQNALLPRGRLQERVFALPHFLSRHGSGFVDDLFAAGALDDFAHHILTVEDGHA